MIRLADDIRSAWRWSSVRLHALTLLAVGLYEIMPALDPALAGMLPTHLRPSAVGVYALVGLILRLTKLKRNG